MSLIKHALGIRRGSKQIPRRWACSKTHSRSYLQSWSYTSANVRVLMHCSSLITFPLTTELILLHFLSRVISIKQRATIILQKITMMTMNVMTENEMTNTSLDCKFSKFINRTCKYKFSIVFLFAGRIQFAYICLKGRKIYANSLERPILCNCTQFFYPKNRLFLVYFLQYFLLQYFSIGAKPYRS